MRRSRQGVRRLGGCYIDGVGITLGTTELSRVDLGEVKMGYYHVFLP